MCHDAPIRVDAGAKPDPRGVARVRRRELVGVSRDGADRATRRLREVVEDELVGRKALGAEVAADRSVVDDDAVLRKPECRGHLIAQVEGRLVRRDDADPIAFEPHDRSSRLERRLVDPRRRELVLEDPRRACEGGRYIAVCLDDVALLIRMRNGGPLAATFEEPVRGGVGMQYRGVGAERGIHVEQRRQLVVLNRDQADRFFGDLARVGRDRRDAVADEQDAVPAEHRPVLQAPSEALAANVRAGQDRADPGKRAGASRLHRGDARVRVRAAHEGRLEGARDIDVGGVRGAPGRLRIAVDPPLRPVEELGMDQRAATVARRHSANPARTFSAWRAMSG